MIRLFIATEICVGSTLIAPENTQKHILALRLKLGDEVELFNGDGTSYIAKIIQLKRKNIELKIITQCLPRHELFPDSTNNPNNRNPEITLAMSIISSDKMDYVIQKATELNVQRIIPLITQRTQQVNEDRLLKRHQHWQNIGISSAEQCGRNILPSIAKPTLITEYLSQIINSSSLTKFILSPPKLEVTTQLPENTAKNIVLLLGPEGGFTEHEIQQATNTAFTPLTLGNNILRADTAAVVGITTIQILYNWYPSRIK